METKTYKELNAELSSINARLEELSKLIAELSMQKKELTSRIKLRQQQLIEDYINRGDLIRNEVNKQLETQKELMEMGFDPTTHDTSMCAEPTSDSVLEIEQNAVEEPVEKDTPAEVRHVETLVEEHNEEVVEEVLGTTNLSSVADYYSSIALSSEELDKILSTGRKKPQLLTPYYYMWGLRKGEFELIRSTPDYQGTSHQMQKSMMELTQSHNETMLLGDEKYRDSYHAPDEGRVFSAYGIAPTLTNKHSNIIVEIGSSPHIDTAA